MNRLITVSTALMLALGAGAADKADGFNRITNDSFWYATDGTPIYSQGGGIFRFKDPKTGKEKYYWYGVHYKEADKYMANPSITYDKCNFEGVNLHTSDDLVNWSPAVVALTKEEVKEHGGLGWVGRMGVAYLPDADLYAMFIQHNNAVMVATSKTPDGPFEWNHEIDMTDRIGTPNTGDQTVFTDPDTGISYLIYSYGKGRNKQYVSRIGMKDGCPDLLDLKEVCKGESREGNCMFKHNGKYYMVASNIYGWDGSLTYYVSADDIYGPYTPVNDMQVMKGSEDDYSHVAQTGFFYTIPGSKKSTVLYCGDRWADFAGNGIGYNQWMPLSFAGDIPVLNSLHSWELNEKTGEWRVAPDNNYVMNGSFEADRRSVPLSVKPRQDKLTGWDTEIIKGNKVVIDGPDSPRLNFDNTMADRRIVSGEKSLYFSDKVPLERKVTQQIASTKYVRLPDGLYTMTAMVKHTPGFDDITMFAESGGKTFSASINNNHTQWMPLRLENVRVRNGKVTIGFHVSGAADAACQIDDVTLVRKQ